MKVPEIIPIKERFVDVHGVMGYVSAVGIEVPGGVPPNSDCGITLYFDTKEILESFPFKGDTYEGVKVYKVVCR